MEAWKKRKLGTVEEVTEGIDLVALGGCSDPT